jgi:hypothetical protein
MKKSLFPFALVFSAITLSSCFSLTSSISRTFRNNLSELSANESAVITFENFSETTGFLFNEEKTTLIFWLKRWNNIDINEALYPNGYSSKNDKAELIVPPGDNSFLFDLYFYFQHSSYEMKNIVLQYNLAAGHKYIVKAEVNRVRTGPHEIEIQIIIGIYTDVKNSEPLKEWILEPFS